RGHLSSNSSEKLFLEGAALERDGRPAHQGGVGKAFPNVCKHGGMGSGKGAQVNSLHVAHTVTCSVCTPLLPLLRPTGPGVGNSPVKGEVGPEAVTSACGSLQRRPEG